MSWEYEKNEILKAARLAEVDRNSFWRLVKRARKSSNAGSIAIKNTDGRVVQEVEEVLQTWKCHFSRLGTPKNSPTFDDMHYENVTQHVEHLNEGHGDDDAFLGQDFTRDELPLRL